MKFHMEGCVLTIGVEWVFVSFKVFTKKSAVPSSPNKDNCPTFDCLIILFSDRCTVHHMILLINIESVYKEVCSAVKSILRSRRCSEAKVETQVSPEILLQQMSML